MTDDELIAAHDRLAGSTVVGLAYYRDEITRRAFERATAAGHRLARWNMVVAVVAALAAVAAIVVPLITEREGRSRFGRGTPADVRPEPWLLTA